MKYVYSTIRFVPDPARGEFVNVGALVGSEDVGEWKIRFVESLKRARALDDRGLLPALWSGVDAIARQLDMYEAAVESSSEPEFEPSEKWLERLWEESRNVLQLSRPAPIVANDADDALDILFRELIVDSERRTEVVRTKLPVLKATRLAYAKNGILRGPYLAERKVVSGQHHRQRFDFVVANGRAVQLAHGWSFQRPDREQLSEDIKAWAWGVRDIREGGGYVALHDGQKTRVPREIDVEAVYLPPIDELSHEVLQEALSAFQEVSVVPVPIDDSDAVGRRAHDLLAEAGVPPNLL